MALQFLKRIEFDTPCGKCICPLFKYSGTFPRTSPSFNLYEADDTVALSGYSSFLCISGETDVSASTYGSICESNSEVISLTGYPGQYNVRGWIGNVTGADASTRTYWSFNYVATGNLNNRIGMVSANASGNASNRSTDPKKGMMASILVFVVDDNNNAVFTLISFNNRHGTGSGLDIYNTVSPSHEKFGVCSILGTTDAIPFGDMRTSQLGLPTYDELTQYLGLRDFKPSTDPYLPDGFDPSGTGGGTGTFSETGDTIGIPGLPTLSAVDTGFITLFNPSAAQVKALANYMWSSSFDLTTFKNIVANPIDCILGLSIVPVDPSNAGSKVVTVGNIPTNITLPYLSSQYAEVDCGTLNVQEFWGSYLDYSPYTKMSLYLPYIGIIPLDIDDVMNASIEIKYHVDVLSGACVAYVLCNGTQLYTYVGQCSSNVPITSNDFTNTVNGILGIAGSIGKLAADGGASAPTEAAGIAANAINALKPNIQKSGAMSGTGGLMGVQSPYLICQRPRQSVPASQNTYTGYPANITARLSDLSGYTEVDTIHLDGLSATQEEQQEIMDLLTSGVII